MQKEVEDTFRELMHFVRSNSNYEIQYLRSIDFREFYKLVLLIERDLKRKAKQV